MVPEAPRQTDVPAGAWEGRWYAPGSLPFLLLLWTVLAVGSLVWTDKALRNDNLDWQGLDITSHALMVYWEERSLPPELLDHDRDYPKASHDLAVALLPVLRDNPILAMRGVALIALFTMLSAQFTLLCRVVRPAGALVLLVLWQWLTGATRFADVSHFTHGSYLYAQAVGMAGFWLALTLAGTGPRRPLLEWGAALAALALAAGAYACHLLPGVMTFGTLGLFFALRGLQYRSKREFLWFFLTGAVGLLTLFSSTQWQLMAASRSIPNCWLPFAHPWLLLTWVPTLGVALARLTRRLDGSSQRPPLADLELVLTAGLMVGGLLQTRFAYEWAVQGTTEAYTVKKFYFFTFPLASFLWMVWLARGAQAAGISVLVSTRLSAIAALVLGSIGLYQLLAPDYRRPNPGRERDPIHVSRVLAERRAALAHCYYHDPQYPMGSIYASVAGLQMNRKIAHHCWESLTFRNKAPVSIWQLVHDGHMSTVLLPRNADPDQVFKVHVPAVEEGGFLRCDLRAVQKNEWAALTLPPEGPRKPRR